MFSTVATQTPRISALRVALGAAPKSIGAADSNRAAMNAANHFIFSAPGRAVAVASGGVASARRAGRTRTPAGTRGKPLFFTGDIAVEHRGADEVQLAGVWIGAVLLNPVRVGLRIGDERLQLQHP